MRKKIVSVLITIVLISMIFVLERVNAASVNMVLSGNSTLVEGQVIDLTLKISTIDAGAGVDAIVAKLEYDKNVFEEVTEENFEGANRWNVQAYNTNTQLFTVTKGSKVNTASDVLKISLKVKNSISTNSTTVKVTNISTSGGAVDNGGTGDIIVPAATITVSKANVPSSGDETNTQAQKINVVSKDTATGKIPKTGENTMGIIIGITIVTIGSIVVYIKYRGIHTK